MDAIDANLKSFVCSIDSEQPVTLNRHMQGELLVGTGSRQDLDAIEAKKQGIT